jgi:hypothetical protein
MTKTELKRAILAQLSGKLTAWCLLDGHPSEQQLILAMEAQKELADEFLKRARGQRLKDGWE